MSNYARSSKINYIFSMYKLVISPTYIYILSFYQNSSVWLEILDSRSWDRNPVYSNAKPRFYHSATRKLKRLWITVVIVYIYPFNGYGELDSYEEPWIMLMATHLLPYIYTGGLAYLVNEKYFLVLKFLFDHIYLAISLCWWHLAKS